MHIENKRDKEFLEHDITVKVRDDDARVEVLVDGPLLVDLLHGRPEDIKKVVVEARLPVLHFVKDAAPQEAGKVCDDRDSRGRGDESVCGGGLQRMFPAIVDDLIAALERGQDVDIVYAAASTVNVIRD